MSVDNFYTKQEKYIGFGIRRFNYIPDFWWWYSEWGLEFHFSAQSLIKKISEYISYFKRFIRRKIRKGD